MLLRRVLPLALLVPLACYETPAPGAGDAAADSVPVLLPPAGPAAAVDTTWPVRRVARWDFSFRWPAAHWLTLVGPRDASCGGSAELYQENGLAFAAADTAIRPSVVVRFVRQAAVDSLLAEERFRRSAESPSGWLGPAAGEPSSPARFGRGGRWWELLAGPSVVDSAHGGDSSEALSRGLAVVTRPDRCRLVLTWSPELLAASVDRWRLLESLRFTGEDPTHELRGLQAFAGFDWHRRVGLVYPPVLNGACLIVANGTVPEGAPVLALSGGAPAWGTLAPAGEQCASVPRQPGDSLHYYDLAPVDPAAGGLDGIGVLAPVHPIGTEDPRTGDLDGDGRPESVGFCSARGLYWGYVRSGSPTGPVVWKLGIRWPERSAGACPADVAVSQEPRS